MSRVGKLPISLPQNVHFRFENSIAAVEGPKGKLERKIDFNGEIKSEKDQIFILPKGVDRNAKANHGLVRSLLNNMIVGVTDGYSKSLKIVGVGYKAQMQGKMLVLNLGYSHPVKYTVPEGISAQVPDPNTVVVSGIEKQQVGQCAAEIRKFRPPEPYKGKGVMYADELVRRKAGKATVK
jgi:large subunit ribosomal protein L6